MKIFLVKFEHGNHSQHNYTGAFYKLSAAFAKIAEIADAHTTKEEVWQAGESGHNHKVVELFIQECEEDGNHSISCESVELI